MLLTVEKKSSQTAASSTQRGVMKIIYRSAGFLLTGALVLTTVNPANANASSTSVAAAIRTASASQSPTPAVAGRPSLASELSQDGSEVSAPSGQGDHLEITLPGGERPTKKDGDLSVGVTAGDGFTTAVQDTGSGTFRALLHITSAEAPSDYAFEVGDDAQLIPLEDGGVSVRDATGDLIGVFEPAWAVDAEGVSVPSSYEIRGSTLVQHVATSPSTTFPVIADPFWIPALFVMARITAHVAARAAQRGVSQAVIEQVVQNGRKTAGNKGTSVFTQGSGKNKIRVIVDNKSGNIITVTKG